jgi:hypothetical protein
MGRVALVVIGILVVAAGAQLVLDTYRRASVAASATASASINASATVTPSATARYSATPTYTPHVPTPAPPPPPTMTASGSGPGNSRVFTLNDTIGYLARYTLGSRCQYDGHLVSTDGTYTNTDFITDTGPTSATKILNNMAIGSYYVAMTTARGCTWSVTFSPR